MIALNNQEIKSFITSVFACCFLSIIIIITAIERFAGGSYCNIIKENFDGLMLTLLGILLISFSLTKIIHLIK